jgi:glycosyltransferase involved in cell wall biosynthesis
MAGISRGNFDILLVNSWEFVTEFRDLARRMPAVALMDAVPSTVDDQLRRRGKGGWKRTLATWLNEIPFSHAVGDYSLFLPMGSDCADALERRYRVPRDRIRITLAPQDLTFWTPAAKTPSGSFRLLFVANDFVRKGGDFLLGLYTQYLASNCTLTVISNDPELEGKSLPAGVVWQKGLNREQIRQAYRESDLFVFPTQQDYMPQVLAEALATGLPCIANDVGGIRDLVLNNETGFLMSCNTPAEVWAQQIEALRTGRSDRERLSKGARAFAERNLDTVAFSRLVGEVVNTLAGRSKGTGSKLTL